MINRLILVNKNQTHGIAKNLVALSVCMAVAGCATKSETGVLVGAVLGTAVGSAVGGREGALVGAGLGAIIGGGIGANMDATDKAKLAQAKLAAANSSARQEFYSQSAKSTVVVEAGQISLVPKSKIVLASDVSERGFVEINENMIAAYVDTPVYAAPSFDATPKLVIPAGAKITTIAAVRGSQDWVLVGSGGFGIGYVHKRMLFAQVKTDVENVLQPKIVTQTSKNTSARPVTTATAKPASKAAQPKSPETLVAASPTLANQNNAPNPTASLLSPGASYLPPKSHLQTAASNAGDYAKSLETGRDKAKVVTASGRSTAELRLATISAECKDITATLLSNSKETGREKTTACRSQDGTWRV